MARANYVGKNAYSGLGWHHEALAYAASPEDYAYRREGDDYEGCDCDGDDWEGWGWRGCGGCGAGFVREAA